MTINHAVGIDGNNSKYALVFVLAWLFGTVERDRYLTATTERRKKNTYTRTHTRLGRNNKEGKTVGKTDKKKKRTK